MPELTELAIELPICRPGTSITTAIAACTAQQTDWILLLDDGGHPQGVFRLVQLMSLTAEAAASVANQTIRHHLHLLHPIEWLPPGDDISHWLPKLLSNPDKLWGIITPQNYQLLPRERLLEWALRSQAHTLPPSLQAIVEHLALPGSIQARNRTLTCNSSWQQAFGSQPVAPNEKPSWQFHRLPLLPVESLMSANTTGDIWLVVASPDGPDGAVLNGWLTGVSHELKSPLTSLLGLSTLLLDERLGQLNTKQRHYADLVQQTVRQLVTTINQLLDWVRLDSGQLTLNPTMIDIHSLWDAVMRQLQEQGLGAVANEKLQGMEWTVSDEVHHVSADPLRLRQILGHLVNYCLTRAETAGTCSGLVEHWGAWVALTIRDNQFLPASQQGRLFHPQGFSNGLSRLELGPALAWHLTRLHGGDITFRSSSENGSHFTVLLPADEISDTTLLLLVAEDGSRIDQVVLALQPCSCRVAIARSLPEALDKTVRLQPAAILVDTQATLGADPITYLRRRCGPTPPILPMYSQASHDQASDDGVILETLRHPLPAPLQKALQIPHLRQLTVLHLCSNLPASQGDSSKDISDWLRRYHCRVLEVDDPLQADLLSGVWQPDVILLDSDFPNPGSCIAQISELPNLSRFPLVVLTAAAAAAAHQFPELRWRAHLQTDQPNSALGLMQTLYATIAAAMD